MKKTIWRNIALAATGLAVTILLAACGKDKTTSADAEKKDADAQEIVVGTGNVYRPFVYLDENGDLKGYDVEVLKAIDDRLPEYTFKYESLDFKNILTSLSSGKVQLAAHQYETNEERQAKYLYGKVGYTDYTSYIVVDGDTDNDFKTLDDLKGKKVGVSNGSNFAYLLEEYNKKNDNAIDIVYTDATTDVFVKQLKNGSTDALLLTKYDVNKINKEFNANLRTSSDPVNVSKTYFIFEKGEEKLQEAVDKALQSLIDDGTLAKISEKELGADYTK